MSITSAMQTGVSGLMTNGEALSVIGNNLANVNTIGFKQGRTLFADMLSTNINRGQIGRGSQLQAVQNIFSQGSLENTGSSTDLAIQGDAMFVLQDPASSAHYYSRAGAFSFDKDNILTNPEGYRVLGFGITNGVSNGILGTIDRSQFATIPARATTAANVVANLDATAAATPAAGTTQATVTGNLPNGTAVGASLTPIPTTVTDSFGTAHTANLTFTKNATADTWDWSMAINGATVGSPVTGTVVFTPYTPYSAGPPVVTEVPSTYSSMTQPSNAVTMNGVSQNIDVALSAMTQNGGSATNTAAATADGTIAFDPANPITSSRFSTTMATYDPLGNAQTTSLYYSKTGDNTWNVYAMRDGAQLGSPTTVTFDSTGVLSSSNNLTFGNYNVDISGTTQYASNSIVTSQNQNGYASGNMAKISVDEKGYVNVLYTNSQTQKVAQVALAKFASLTGLDKVGGSLYSETVASGAAVVDPSNLSSNKVAANSLEQSNVDMADQLVKMITTQRAYTASSKTITAADQLMQDTLNIIR